VARRSNMGKPSSSSRSAERIVVSLRESGDGHIADVTVKDRETTTHWVRVSAAAHECYGGGASRIWSSVRSNSFSRGRTTLRSSANSTYRQSSATSPNTRTRSAGAKGPRDERTLDGYTDLSCDRLPKTLPIRSLASQDLGEVDEVTRRRRLAPQLANIEAS
jgi:hypothetical protein